MVQFLVENAANVKLKNNEGITAAEFAIRKFIHNEKLGITDNQALRKIMVFLTDPE